MRVGILAAFAVQCSALAVGDVNASDAYVFAFPLVLLNVTRSYEPLPPNLLFPKRAYPSADERSVVRPNQDTLYSVAWLNFEFAKKQTVTLTMEDTSKPPGRYYLFPVMDAWTNVITSPGWRTTGPNATVLTLKGPKATSDGEEENDLTVTCPTNLAWMLGRTAVRGEKDLPACHAQQDKYHLTTGPDPVASPHVTDGKREGAPTPPDVVLAMSAEEFFTHFMDLMVSNPPLPADAPFVASTLTPLGLKPGGKWDKVPPAQQKALTDGMAAAIATIKQASYTPLNGWTSWGNTTGAYGTDYLLRARTALHGLGANLAADSMYYSTEGSLAPGTTLHLKVLPPVKAFWSVTAYDVDGYFIPNSLSRYEVGSESDFLVTRPDGSICITAAVNDPQDKTSNWLPTPTNKANFTSTFRLYWPTAAVLSGEWAPPAWVPGSTCN